MLRNFLFICLWTFVNGVILAVITVSEISLSPLATPSIITKTISPSDCIFSTALDAANSILNVCECSSTLIAAMETAVSGISTTSYCALGGPAPTGFSQLPAISLPPLFEKAPNCSNGGDVNTLNMSSGKAAMTTSAGDPLVTLTGQIKPTVSTTGSGALKHGVAVCLGLMVTTLVAVFLL